MWQHHFLHSLVHKCSGNALTGHQLEHESADQIHAVEREHHLRERRCAVVLREALLQTHLEHDALAAEARVEHL